MRVFTVLIIGFLSFAALNAQALNATKIQPEQTAESLQKPEGEYAKLQDELHRIDRDNVKILTV
ncbi:MAG: hypothetical protein LBS39_00375, partial [Campylobacteraceae bacterium]|nr:hypothetical protein [Campylobacteraceae bacterium]